MHVVSSAKCSDLKTFDRQVMSDYREPGTVLAAGAQRKQSSPWIMSLQSRIGGQGYRSPTHEQVICPLRTVHTGDYGIIAKET